MRIVLSGYYGFDNAGDEALLSAITSSISHYAPDVEFTVLSGAPEKTYALHSISAIHYMNPLAVTKALYQCDLLISGGGSIFQDVTSTRSLIYYIGVVALAKIIKRPVVFYAQGVGPINHNISKFLMRIVANKVDYISLRDEQSLDFLRSIGVNRPPMEVTADPVFSLRMNSLSKKNITEYLATINPDNKPLIGVSLRNWTNLNGYELLLAKELDIFSKKGYQILFLPLAFPEDICACENVASLMISRAHIASEHAFTSEEHLALISKLDMMIGMRLHALVFSACCSVPFAGISYDPKVESFLKIFNQKPLTMQEPMLHKELSLLLNDQEHCQMVETISKALREKSEKNAEIALSIIRKNRAFDSEKDTEVSYSTIKSTQPDADNATIEGTYNNHTGRNFILVAITIFFSKALGFLRDVLFASIFGTTIITDAYQTIFSLPSLLFSSVGNALSAVNIPDLTDHLKNKGKKASIDYIANIYLQITLLGTILSLIGIIVAPTITHIIAPGLDSTIEEISIKLCRIMMPTLLFVNLTYLSTGILQVHGHFLLSSIISLPFNLIIILALFLKPGDLLFLGFMTTIGWLLQYLIQVPVLRRYGYKIGTRINFFNSYTISLYRSLIPILMGNSLLQLCLIIDRSFATNLEDGTAAALSFGSNLFMTITSVIVIAMTTVVFPRLSSYCLSRDYKKIQSLMANIFKVFLLILVPYLAVVICYNHQMIALVYERGAFNANSTHITALSFLCYSLAVVGYACQEVFNRVYYALKKFYIPMFASISCLITNILLTFLLYKPFKIAGITLSTSGSMLLYAIIMYLFLCRDLGGGMFHGVGIFALKLLIPISGMGLIFFLGRITIGISVLGALITAIAGSLIYLVLTILMKLHRVIFSNEV